MKLYLRNDEGVAMKFVGIRRVENAGQILKWKYIKSKLEFVEGDSTMNIEAQFNLCLLIDAKTLDFTDFSTDI